MIAAERLDVSVEWAPLLRGEIRLDRAEFVSPQITLVRAADGRVSWDFAGDTAAPVPQAQTTEETGDTASGPFLVGFDRAAISDGGPALDRSGGAGHNHRHGTRRRAFPSLRHGPGNARGLRRGGRAPARGHDRHRGCRALAGGSGAPDLRRAVLVRGAAAFDGRLSLTPALDGTFTLEATDLAPLLALAGAAMPELPEGVGRDRMAAAGRVTLTDAGSVHLRDGMVTLDDNELGVALDLLPGGERPTLRGTVSGGILTLASGSDGDGRGRWRVGRRVFGMVHRSH
jgi:AsmA protein